MKVSVRINKTRDFKGQRNHDFRRGSQPSYIDSSRSHLNKTVIQPPEDFTKVIADLEDRAILKGGRKWQTNSPYFFDGIITFDKEYSAKRDEVPIDKMDECAQEFIDSFCKRYGVEPVYLVRHSDEATPHYHFKMTAQTIEGKPVSRIINRGELIKLQDMVGDAFAKLNFERGISKPQRLKDANNDWHKANVINRSVKKLHSDLPQELAQAQQELATYHHLLNEKEGMLKRLEKEIADKREDVDKTLSNYDMHIKRKRQIIMSLKRLQEGLGDIDESSFEVKRGLLGKKSVVAPVEVVKNTMLEINKQRILIANERAANKTLNEKLEQKKLEIAQELSQIKLQKQELEAWEVERFQADIFKGQVFIGLPISESLSLVRDESTHRLNWVAKHEWKTLNECNSLYKFNGARQFATVKEGSPNEQAFALSIMIEHMKKIFGTQQVEFIGPVDVYKELLKIKVSEKDKLPEIIASKYIETMSKTLDSLDGQNSSEVNYETTSYELSNTHSMT